jgi:hypothetical protein
MTLVEYKANPESWEPTFTVATLADYTKWQDRVSGNDYERVLVSANITATMGIDLTYSKTKQVVFANGVTLTLNLNELEGKCFYYQERDDDEELWLSKPKIAVTNSFASGNVYCFQNCNNIDSPTIASATGGASSINGGSVYCFQNCDNIDSPTITTATGGASSNNTSTPNINGGSVYCFQNCDNIDSPTITTATGGNSLANNDARGRTGGPVYCFQNCNNIDSPTIASATGGNAAASAGQAASPGGVVYCFHNCDNIKNPTIKKATSGTGGDGTPGLYCFYGCNNIESPTIASATPGNSTAGTAYGFYLCCNVADPKAILAAANIGSYMHYLWSGLITNRAGSNAKTALFSPDFGPYQLVLSNKPIPSHPVTLSWQFITPAGDAVSQSAILQVSTDNGATWANIYTGINTNYTYNVPSDIDDIRFRVYSTNSGYAYSGLTQFTSMPVISGTDEDLGAMDASFTPYQFSVSKAPDDESDWTAAFITVTLDGKALQTFNAAIGDVKTLSITGSAWSKVLNGEHTLKISAVRIVDGQPAGTESVRTLTFTRAQSRAVISLSNPAVSETMPERIEVSIGGAFPDGSSLTLETCNNANDPEPAWEDMTADYLAGTPHIFENGSKVDMEWGVNIRVMLERNTAEGACYIDSIVGDFS